MTVYRKCRPCKHRDNCEIKAALAEAIKGFHVGTILHRCKAFEPDFRPGDNVWVRTQNVPHSYEYEADLAVFPAHFVQYSKTLGRAIVYIEPGAKSQCGEMSFEPANGKEGFCKLSYAPYRARSQWSFDRGIIGRRDGRTPIKDCCGLPCTAPACSDCAWLKEEVV